MLPVRYELGSYTQKTAFFMITAVKTSNVAIKSAFHPEDIVCVEGTTTRQHCYVEKSLAIK
jgi:hypothetical protein